MSITVEIDEAMWQAVVEATRITDPTELVRRLLEREIQLHSAQRRLAAAGGTMPDLSIPPRRRMGTECD